MISKESNKMYIWIGLCIGIFVALFGLIWTVLERKLIVSRKHVTGVSGFTSTMVGAVMIAGSLYAMTEKILHFILALAVVVLAYATICHFVVKKEYSTEERYTKEQ